MADDPIDRYAFARVGYHRGLDALRAAAGAARATCDGATSPIAVSSGRCTCSQLAAGAIGEVDEEQRCDLFLRQLDPEWGTREP